MLAPPVTLVEAKRQVSDWLYGHTQGFVQSGPFMGMKVLDKTSWPDTHLAPILLGCYEEELHGVLEQHIRRLGSFERPARIAVVGCAEGYYAIGLKLRMRSATVYGVDKDNAALSVMAEAAQVNGVEIVTGADLSEVFRDLDLLIMDCEGHEVEYLDLGRFPQLASAAALVEIHNMPGQATDEILLERFKGTHRIDMLLEGPRNPNKFKELCPLTSDARWMAVNEGRPCLMGWFHMQPRGFFLA